MVIMLLHVLWKVFRIEVRSQLLQNILQWWQILVLAKTGVKAHISLHLGIVIVHKLTHTVRDIVFSLSLNSLLVVLQLTSEQICLLILELNILFFGIHLAGKAFNIVLVDAPVGDFRGVSEPHVVVIVTNKLRSHLKDLDLAHLL